MITPIKALLWLPFSCQWYILVVYLNNIYRIKNSPISLKLKVFTEEDWNNVETTKSAYAKSKVLAEKAAWDFLEELPEDEKFELTTINPAFVLGPVIGGAFGTSARTMKQMLSGEMAMIPRWVFIGLDVTPVCTIQIWENIETTL